MTDLQVLLIGVLFSAAFAAYLVLCDWMRD